MFVNARDIAGMSEEIESDPLNFELFQNAYKSTIRPKGMVKQLESVFGLDAKFKAEFRYLRKFLLADRVNWSDDIIAHLGTNDALAHDIDDHQQNTLRELYRVHADNFRLGEFGEAYLDSLEDVALFFIHHDIKSIWVVGAYREIAERLIDVISDKSQNNRNLPLRETMRALTSALLIEVNQLQRCFTMYERRVSTAIVKDINQSAFMRAVSEDPATDSVFPM